MWNPSSGASLGALLQNLAQSNPQVFQTIMQMVAAQRQQGVGGIGSLMPRAGMSPRGDNSMIGGPMPMGRPDMAQHLNNPNLAGNARDAIMGRPSNMAYEVGKFYPPGLDRFPMPSGTNAPPAYSGQPPQGGLWSMGRQRPNPGGGGFSPGMGGMGMGFGGQGGTYGESGTPFGWEGELAPARLTREQLPGFIRAMGGWPTPGQGRAATGVGGVGSGSVRSDQGRPAPPYRAPAYNPQPTGPKYMPPTGPKTYGQTTPAEAPPSYAQPKPFPQPAAQPSMAGDGTTGLDWYAMQAGN